MGLRDSKVPRNLSSGLLPDIRYVSCSLFAQHPGVTEFISVKEEAELGEKKQNIIFRQA